MSDNARPTNFIRLEHHEVKTILNFMFEMGKDSEGKNHLTDQEISAMRKLQAIKALQEAKSATRRIAPTRTLLNRNELPEENFREVMLKGEKE